MRQATRRLVWRFAAVMVLSWFGATAVVWAIYAGLHAAFGIWR